MGDEVLVQGLECDEGGLIESQQPYPLWSPDRAFPAAVALLEVLEIEALEMEKRQSQPHRHK